MFGMVRQHFQMLFMCCRAKIMLDKCCQAVIDSSIKLPTLCISGVDNFQNAVVFAKVQEDEEFNRLLVIAGTVSCAYLSNFRYTIW